MQLFLGGSNIALAQVTLTGVNHTVQQVRLPPVVPNAQTLAQRARIGHLHRTDEGAGHAEDAVHEGVGDADGCGSGMRGGALGVLANRLQRLLVVGRRLGIHGPSVVAVKYLRLKLSHLLPSERPDAVGGLSGVIPFREPAEKMHRRERSERHSKTG